MLNPVDSTAALNQAESQREYSVKAVFLYRFTKYLTWPQEATDTTFIISVIGDSPIIASLKTIAQTERVNDRKIEIRTIPNPAEIGDCHFLFIARSASDLLPEILARTKEKTIVTIGEREGMARQGTAFNFIIISGKIKFEINRSVLQGTKIKPSSQLLRLARIVENGSERPE